MEKEENHNLEAQKSEEIKENKETEQNSKNQKLETYLKKKTG